MASGTTIPAGSCTIVVTITSTTPGTVTNTTGALRRTPATRRPASAPLTVNALPTLAKTITPSTIGIGGTATLTITLGNTNPTPITLAAAVRRHHAGRRHDYVGGNTGTCTGVTVAPTSITMAIGQRRSRPAAARSS